VDSAELRERWVCRAPGHVVRGGDLSLQETAGSGLALAYLQDGSRRLRSEKCCLVRAPTMLHSTTWPRLSALLSALEWRGGRREDPVVGVRVVARGDGDQGRLCEGSAHEFKTDREAIRGEASRYNHGGKATIRR
jgi:hypothetical protein